MTEASLFYELESAGLGFEFLDDVQRVVDALREYPKLGRSPSPLSPLTSTGTGFISWRPIICVQHHRPCVEHKRYCRIALALIPQ